RRAWPPCGSIATTCSTPPGCSRNASRRPLSRSRGRAWSNSRRRTRMASVMSESLRTKRPLGEAAIPWDEFDAMRAENLARWPTGAAVDLDEAVEFHLGLASHKRLAEVLRRAKA